MKAWVFLANEFDEAFQIGMRAQFLGRVIFAGEVSFGDARMDFVVADLMQQNLRPVFSTLQFRD